MSKTTDVIFELNKIVVSFKKLIKNQNVHLEFIPINQYQLTCNKIVIENKEKMIEFLKSKIQDFDDDLRAIEYKIKAMEHLIVFEKSQIKNKDCKNLLNYLEKDIKYIFSEHVLFDLLISKKSPRNHFDQTSITVVISLF